MYARLRVYCRIILSRRHTWRFDSPIAANLIASENRTRFSPPTGCGHTWRFFSPIAAMWHFNHVPRLQVPLLSSILKNHVIKSPNLISWLYWRFAAMSVRNRGNGHTRRFPANLIADFKRRSRRSAKIAIAAPGTLGDFRRSPRSAYKIA